MSLPTNDLASPDRDQIGTVAGIRSEWPAGIVGIRNLTGHGVLFPSDSNPLGYVRRSAPPFLIFTGSNDRILSPSQTLHLHTALRALGAKSTRYVVEGAGHGDLAFISDPAGGLPWSTNQVMTIIVDFLRHPG